MSAKNYVGALAGGAVAVTGHLVTFGTSGKLYRSTLVM